MLNFCSNNNNIECDVEVIPIEIVDEAYGRILNSDARYLLQIDIGSLKCDS